MVKVIKIGEVPIEPEKEYQCPRGCGKLRYGRSFQYLKKENQCKKCKGLIIPGGESTVISKMMVRYNLLNPI
ncbi:MAG: hypothetical protein COC13_03950, partial [Methanobacteriota archaeon]